MSITVFQTQAEHPPVMLPLDMKLTSCVHVALRTTTISEQLP